MLVNLMVEPAVLLLDEPLTSLDVVVAEEMKQLLRSFKQGRITIFSTHILDLALDLCDEIVLLSHGVLETGRQIRPGPTAGSRRRSFAPCVRRTMRNTLKLSFALKNTYRGHTAFCTPSSRSPCSSGRCPNRFTAVRGFKVFANFLSALWELHLPVFRQIALPGSYGRRGLQAVRDPAPRAVVLAHPFVPDGGPALF